MASELLGVGYIIGMRTSAIMMAGAVLGYLVLIPTIYFVGEHASVVIPPSSEKMIKDMKISLLVAESNLANAARIADRLYAIDRGEIIYQGDPRKVLENKEVMSTIHG